MCVCEHVQKDEHQRLLRNGYLVCIDQKEDNKISMRKCGLIHVAASSEKMSDDSIQTLIKEVEKRRKAYTREIP